MRTQNIAGNCYAGTPIDTYGGTASHAALPVLERREPLRYRYEESELNPSSA